MKKLVPLSVPLLVLLLSLWGPLASAMAQDVPVPSRTLDSLAESEKKEMLQAIKAQALVLEIRAFQRDASQNVVWENEVSRVTVHGRAITYKLEGGNLMVACQFTPYRQDNNILLMVQTQIMVQDKDRKSVQYSTHVSSLHAGIGEPVRYFPLGRRKPDGSGPATEIELHVVIGLYDGTVPLEQP